MAIVFLLAIFGFLNAGPTGISLEVFDPGKISVAGFEGFFLAVVFSVQGLTGWEASAPLAEETRDPKRNVPRSVMLSITIIGVFLIIVFWGVITGFNNDPSAITGSTDLPALALAHKVWGSAWIIILFAFLNSVVGASLACANVATRMWYSMARSGSFPKALAAVHPVHKTPTNAILAQMFVSIGSGIIGGIIYGPDVSFFFLVGLVLVLAVTVVYIMANIAVFRFYWTEHRDEFNVILHVVFPVVSSAILIYAVYKSFPQPDPYWQAIFLDGGWLIIGIVLLVVLYLRGNEDWLVKAGEAVSEA
jgi:amino acid transporter